ncbi:hypothetical protein OWV82_020385 [Melia azedarach]|uniref:Uncharacterized protein n=1 Tax=Melia azedarach TaxID=155640 RepID=A0ACC1X609_MELAZ|nr:hypothetical protein OWV82_020385 [Melia azedarach]
MKAKRERRKKERRGKERKIKKKKEWKKKKKKKEEEDQEKGEEFVVYGFALFGGFASFVGKTTSWLEGYILVTYMWLLSEWLHETI